MSLKKNYSKDKKTCTVTFTVKANETHGAEKITLAGDFNSWSSTDTPLTKGKEYQFRYLLDGKNWENDWEADKYIPAPFSHTDNSVVICEQK